MTAPGAGRREAGAGGSLLRRVFLRMSLTMCAAVVLVVALLLFEFQSHVDTLRDRSLSGQAADVARHVARGRARRVTVDLPPALAQAYESDAARFRYAVLDTDGRLLAGSPGVVGPLDPDGVPPAGNARYFATLDPDSGRRYYGASLSHSAAGGALVIQVQQSAEHEDVLADTLLDELADEVAWVVVLVFAAILLVTYWTLRASLSSLTRVSAQAAAIGPGTLERRLALDGVPDEVRPTVRAVNEALERMQRAFEQQRRFVADAAHEMRTPIAVLRAHLDILGRDDAQALERDLAALDRVVGQLLRLAQVDSLDASTHGDVDLHAVAVNTAALMGPAAIAAGRTLGVGGDAHARVTGDAGALEVALRNLVENALNHAPAGSEVEIEVSAAARSLRVLDRGPGVPEADRERIFERFWRRERSDGTGAGLGLSIVSRIAAAHGATVRVDPREGGGAAFTIAFPEPV